MNRIITSVAALVFLGTATAFADHERNIDQQRNIEELAFDLKVQAARVCREVQYTFRHSPDYRRLYQCAYEVYRLADRIEHEIDHGCQPGSLHDAVADVDELLHNLEDAVGGYKDVKSVPTASFEFGGRSRGSIGFGYTGISQSHLRRLCAEMECLNGSIHDLDDIVNGASGIPVPPPRNDFQPPLPPLPQSAPSRPSAHRPVFQHDRSGFSFSIVLKR